MSTFSPFDQHHSKLRSPFSSHILDSPCASRFVMISERDIARLLGPRTDDNIPIQLEKTMPFRFNLLAVLLTFTGVAIADSYVIENINVVPMTEETVLGEHSVLVVDDKVVKICKQARDCRRSEVQRINGTGKYLIPGFLHV